jgi:MFS family permease
MTKGQRWVLALTSTASLMILLDGLVVTTALHVIALDLHASIADLEWTVNAYTLPFAVLLLAGAALGERYGRRRVLVGGLALFGMASAGFALAPSLGWLIATRAIQGVGAAAVAPAALSVLSAAFGPQQRPRALDCSHRSPGWPHSGGRSSAERSCRT